MVAILILLFSITSAKTSKSKTGRMDRISPSPSPSPSPSQSPSTSLILERNNQLIAHSDVLAMNRRYNLRGSSGVVLTNVIKTKNRNQEGVTTPPCRFKYHSKCPRNAWFTRSFPVKEAEESVWNIIGRKLIEQGVLQALALD